MSSFVPKPLKSSAEVRVKRIIDPFSHAFVDSPREHDYAHDVAIDVGKAHNNGHAPNEAGSMHTLFEGTVFKMPDFVHVAPELALHSFFNEPARWRQPERLKSGLVRRVKTLSAHAVQLMRKERTPEQITWLNAFFANRDSSKRYAPGAPSERGWAMAHALCATNPFMTFRQRVEEIKWNKELAERLKTYVQSATLPKGFSLHAGFIDEQPRGNPHHEALVWLYLMKDGVPVGCVGASFHRKGNVKAMALRNHQGEKGKAAELNAFRLEPGVEGVKRDWKQFLGRTLLEFARAQGVQEVHGTAPFVSGGGGMLMPDGRVFVSTSPRFDRYAEWYKSIGLHETNHGKGAYSYQAKLNS